MFEKTVLRRADQGAPISLGQLAEALLFYKSVHLILDAGVVGSLAKQLGTDAFIDLLKRSNLTAVFVDEWVATMTEKVGPLEVHKFSLVTFHGTPEEQASLQLARRRAKWGPLAASLLREGFSRRDIAKLVEALSEMAPHKSLSTGFTSGTMEALASKDAQEADLIQDAIRRQLQRILPGPLIPQEFKFRVVESDLGLYAFTDLNLAELDKLREAHNPAAGSITQALLLNTVLDARVDLSLASHYGGDFVTSPLVSEIIQARLEGLMRRSEIHRSEIESFQAVILEDCPSLAETIDSGDRSFDSFLKLLDKADRFRDWANGIHPDRTVVSAYLEEASKQDWIQGGRAKGLRYVIGLGLGLPMVNPIVSAAWTLADTFGLDKWLGGWRPSHFVTSKWRPFVS